MTLRITVGVEGTTRRIRLVGRLSHEEVSELERVVAESAEEPFLELAELRSADEAGLTALRRLRDEGVEMRNVPPHLAWRIEVEEK